MIRLTIHGQPVSKKNSMQIAHIGKRVFPVPSKSYRRWIALAKPQVMAQKRGVPGLPIDYPVRLKILAYRHTKRKIDLSNIYAAVEDMLQKYGVLQDDALVESHDGSRKMLGVPEDEARVEIEIERLA
ncbi:MAG: RusA family crossover junction endodeoxyribonuclease [Candidatus Aminicenantales bacterium]